MFVRNHPKLLVQISFARSCSQAAFIDSEKAFSIHNSNSRFLTGKIDFWQRESLKREIVIWNLKWTSRLVSPIVDIKVSISKCIDHWLFQGWTDDFPTFEMSVDPLTKLVMVQMLYGYVQHTQHQFYLVFYEFNAVKIGQHIHQKLLFVNSILAGGEQFSKRGPAQSKPVKRPIFFPVKS